MVPRRVLLLTLLSSIAHADVLEFDLKAGSVRSVNVPSAVDDSNFTEPRGYADHGSRTRPFIRRIELTNTSGKPLTGRLLSIDERDWSNMEGLKRSLGLSVEPERHALTIQRLFAFWKDHRSHAGTGSPLAYEPFATLNFWGYTLCGEDTQAFARLAYGCDIPARFVHLNGHLAAEYRYDGGWHVVDGDQNAVYLRLDNQTLASADDLRADPFLALRTKVFGKHSPQEISASAFNSALLEHVAPAEPKPLKLKAGAAPLNTFTLHPEETLVWHCDTPPAKPVAKLSTEKPEVLQAAALATIEHRALAKNYERSEAGAISITSPFPIWKTINHTTGETVEPKPDEVTFKTSIPTKGAADQISVFSQCSRHALPLLHRGDNTVKLVSQSGAARVAVHYDPAKNLRAPSVRASTRNPLPPGPPLFAIAATPGTDHLWWQVSETRDFTFVAPSLEGIMPASKEFRFDPLTDTFLSPRRPYYLRLKARSQGIWGEWSEAFEFRSPKPMTPFDIRFEELEDNRVRLSWVAPAQDAEFLIYASNRRDFVPDRFAEDEIVAMDHTKVTERRDNRNLLATVKELQYEFTPTHRFYRIIVRKNGAHSVPTPLIELPPGLAANLPAPTILQIRATKEGAKDVYRAKETVLPPTPAAKK
jgi:hypothetical protein